MSSDPAVDFELLFAETPGEMLLVFAPDWTMLAANKLWYAHTGKEPRDIVGRNLFEVFPANPEDADADGVSNMEASVQRVLRDKVADAMPVHRYDIPGPDGSFVEKYWAVTHTPVLDEDGNVTHIWNRGADVTEYMMQQAGKTTTTEPGDTESAEVVARQYRAAAAASRQLKEQLAELPTLAAEVEEPAAALADSQERLAAVAASTSEAILTLDEAATINTANEAAGALFGYSQVELVGQPATVLGGPVDDDDHQPALGSEFLRSVGDEGARIQTELQGSNGDSLPVEIAVEPFRQAGRRYYAVSVRDRTREVRRLNELIRSNRDLERFAYVASHDLQTPARAIGLLVDVLREDLPTEALSEETTSYLELLSSAASKMRAQISGLLQLSRLKQDKGSYQRLNLAEVVADVVRQLQPEVEDSHAELTIADDLGEALGNPTQVQVLFRNLLENAIRYQEEGRVPVVTVLQGATSESRYTAVVIQDNGIGIPTEQRDRVFDIFHRLHGDAEDQYTGSGIGLALCRKIVDQHEGHISIRNNPDGAGTAIEILLPNPTHLEAEQ